MKTNTCKDSGKRGKNMIGIFCRWYDRNDDMTPDYDKTHYTNIYGVNPADCMSQINLMREHHDLCKFTIIEIINVYEI